MWRAGGRCLVSTGQPPHHSVTAAYSQPETLASRITGHLIGATLILYELLLYYLVLETDNRDILPVTLRYIKFKVEKCRNTSATDSFGGTEHWRSQKGGAMRKNITKL